MRWLNSIMEGIVTVLIIPCLLFISFIDKVISSIEKVNWVINSYLVSLLFVFLALISGIILFTIDKILWDIIGIYILSSIAILFLYIVITITQSSENLIHKVLKKHEKGYNHNNLGKIGSERIFRLYITSLCQIFYFASLFWGINGSFASEGAFVTNYGLLLYNFDFFYC